MFHLISGYIQDCFNTNICIENRRTYLNLFETTGTSKKQCCKNDQQIMKSMKLRHSAYRKMTKRFWSSQIWYFWKSSKVAFQNILTHKEVCLFVTPWRLTLPQPQESALSHGWLTILPIQLLLHLLLHRRRNTPTRVVRTKFCALPSQPNACKKGGKRHHAI